MVEASSWSIVGVTVALALVLVYVLVGRRRRLPPGPWGLPVLGYYPFLGKEPEKTINELGKKYGGVLGFYMGPQYMVILNDWNAAVEAYKMDATLDRPGNLFEDIPFHLGVTGANGEEWRNVRRIMMRSFKDIGLQNTRLEELIKEEVGEIVLSLATLGPEPVDLKRFLETHFVNSIMTLVLGHPLPDDHPSLRVVIEGINSVLEKSPTMSLMNFSPRLMRLMQSIGVEEKFSIHRTLEGLAKFIVSETESKLKSRTEEAEADGSFIELFRQELKSLSHKEMNDELIANTVKGNVLALLAGGSETSRSSLLYLLAAVAEHPDKQARVHEELDRVVGQDGTLYWSERAKVPYTHATILESMRWRTLVPISTMRIVTKDIQVQGYDVPEGTFLALNTSRLHNDPKYWTDPEKFVPERFLTEEGQKVISDIRSYAPFSFGKRMCPGKLIAHLEIFQYFVMLMQKFRVMPCDGNNVNFKHLTGLSFSPYDMKFRFIPRS